MKTRNYLTKLPRATALANRMLLKHYRSMARAEAQKQPIVWIDINFPSFFIWAMNMVPVFPQIHAAFQAQRKKVKNMLQELESKWEIPHTICGEVKGLIGIAIYGNDVAFALPSPHFLVTANTSCGIVSKGFRYLSQQLGTELLFADFPYNYDGVTDDMVKYSASQIKNVLNALAWKTGQKLQLGKAREWTENTVFALKLWEAVCRLNVTMPSPFDALDLFLFSSVMTSLPNDEEMFKLFAVLYNEVYEQVQKNEKISHNEKCRVLWHYLPIYSQKKFFQKLFDEQGISVSTASYFPMPENYYDGWDYEFTYPLTKKQIQEAHATLKNSGTLDLDLDGLIELVTLGLLETDVNSNIHHKERVIEGLIRSYKIDGVIMHCDRSCRTQSLPQHEIRRFLSEELGVPVLLFDADSMDDRFFSPSQITTRFEAFVEMLHQRTLPKSAS